MFIKVCGITSVEDALMALHFKINAIGLVFHKKSPRFVNICNAMKIMDVVCNKIKVVGVFKYKSEISECSEILDHLDFIQVYEPVPDLAHKLILGVSKKTEEKAAFYIVDSSHGKGLRSEYPEDLFGLPKERTIISGGLTPYNVDCMISKYTPFGVDVSSGVELRKGVKSYYLLKEFVEKVRERK